MKTILILFALVGLSLLIPQAFAIGAPPPERVPVTILRVMDINGNSVDLVNAGEQIQIQADLANAQDTVQSLVYIVEVYDEDDTQVFRGWIEATLESMDSFSPTVSWIPEKPGYYSTKMMVWEALDNPSALSPGLESEFYVVGNMNALNENRSCNEGKELVFKINYKKVACVFPETLIKLLGRGWANWHDWYSPLFIDNLRQGPQDVDNVHAEFVKREIMRDPKVADYFLRAKKYDFSCCSYQYNEDDRNPRYQLVVNISDLANEKQLVVVYDLSQTKVVESKLKDLVKLGGPITTPRLEPIPQNSIQIIIPNGASDPAEQKNFVVIQENMENVDYLFFINQDDVNYKITGLTSSGVGSGDFDVYISPHDDWKIPLEPVAYVDLTAYDPDTGEAYSWMNTRIMLEPEHGNDQQENLTLYVSNQSFENSPVDITVMIDGKVLVDRDFDVGNQHVYIDYHFMLTPGTHTIHAKSTSGEAELEKEFDIDEQKWAVLSYWYYPDDTDFEFPHFDFVVYDTPVGFA